MIQNRFCDTIFSVFCILSQNEIGVATTAKENHEKKNSIANNIITLQRRKTKTGLKKLPNKKNNLSIKQ